ncbi:MAG: polyphenol oxidase family protein [Acidimicrobiales bacterium]
MSDDTHIRRLGAATVVRWTTRAEGDLRPGPSGEPGVLESVARRPVAWSRQVHGAGVAVVAGPGSVGPADALVTTRPGLALAVFTADCAPVVLSGGDDRGQDRVVAAVHAGWRGLVAGVVEAAVDQVRQLGATAVVARLGPCIHPGCYPFGAEDLASVVDHFGGAVATTTADGRPALDVPAAVRIAVQRAGAVLVGESATCTSCAAAECFSHRARGDDGRHATLVWRDG